MEAIKTADVVCGEAYTTWIPEEIRRELEQIIGREIIWLARKDLEELSDQFIMKAKQARVVLLVGGDPFIATTHMALRVRAAELGVGSHVIHAPSIYSVVCSTGLFSYKFGRTISIPFPDQGPLSEVSYDIIAKNQTIDAHTLVLLDVKEQENRYMTIREGFEVLERLEHTRRDGVIHLDMIVVGLARVGTKSSVIRAGRLGHVKKIPFDVFPQAIVIPGSLHFAEAEALVKLWGAPDEILNLA